MGEYWIDTVVALVVFIGGSLAMYLIIKNDKREY